MSSYEKRVERVKLTAMLSNSSLCGGVTRGGPTDVGHCVHQLHSRALEYKNSNDATNRRGIVSPQIINVVHCLRMRYLPQEVLCFSIPLHPCYEAAANSACGSTQQLNHYN